MTDDDPDTIRSVLIAWIVAGYMNFLVQLAMIIIFMQIKTKQTEAHYREVLCPGDESQSASNYIIDKNKFDNDFA